MIIMMTTITKLHDIFKGSRIVGLAGNKNTGKTNNLAQMIKEYREEGYLETEIYVYGLPVDVIKALENIKSKK